MDVLETSRKKSMKQSIDSIKNFDNIIPEELKGISHNNYQLKNYRWSKCNI